MPTVSDLEVLRRGAPRQRRALAVLQELAIFERLAGFDPVLVGTLPLPIYTETSDLDIACEVHDAAAWVRAAAVFSDMPEYCVQQLEVRGVASTVIGFSSGDFTVELFGQPVPVALQHGYRHLRIEARVLAIAGEPAIAAITAWKRAGLKTEPAFARWLGLPGDPYLAMLAIDALADEELRRLIDDRPPHP